MSSRKKYKYDVGITKNPLFNRLPNALSHESIAILVNEAKRSSMNVNESEHGMLESKCFCFNACIELNNENDISIVNIHSLLPNYQWNSLDNSVQNTCLQLINICRHQINKLRGNLKDRIIWVAFELIRIPLNHRQQVPALQWHRDPGYYDKLDEDEELCYSDYTTIFMLTDPSSWKGGELQLQVNSIEEYKQNIQKITQIKYEYNEAITFYNKDSIHRVTRINSSHDSDDRIIFTCSFYGPEETKKYLEYLESQKFDL